MTTQTVPYQWFVENYFSDPKLVRRFGRWQIWSAHHSHVCVLLVVNEVEEVVIKCQYENALERAEDIDLLYRLPPDGNAGAGVFACLKPVPPVLSAGNARPWPPPARGPEREAEPPAA